MQPPGPGCGDYHSPYTKPPLCIWVIPRILLPHETPKPFLKTPMHKATSHVSFPPQNQELLMLAIKNKLRPAI